MPLDVTRLRDSDLAVIASGDAFRAAVLLWCASWHQLPAGSLPKDERLLANLAGYGRDLEGWSRVRDDALHGFVECSDGRLYHSVVAEKALEAHGQRKAQKERTKKATDARRNGKRNDPHPQDRDDHRHDTRNEVQQTRPDRTKTKTKTSTARVERESPAVERKPSAAPPGSLSQAPAPEKPGSQGLKALGSPLPENWTPDDELCETVKREFGMTDDDIRSELLAFHAKHAAEATYSANWRATFTTWCKRWKEHRDKQAPPRISLSKSAKGENHEADRSVRTEGLSDIARRHAASGISFGPKPTGIPDLSREPESGAAPRLLSEG
jgi:hypothetical protein